MVRRPRRQRDKDEIDFLKWNYEQCQTGYNSRDRVTGEIFYKMTQIFTTHIILLSVFIFLIKNLIQISNNSPLSYLFCILVFFLIWLSGLLSLGALLSNLESMFSCKAELRAQCYFIEKKLAKIYPIEKVGRQQWMCIETRCRHFLEKLFVKNLPLGLEKQDSSTPDYKNMVDTKNRIYAENMNCFDTVELDGESRYIRRAAWLLIVLWFIFLLLFLLCLISKGNDFIGELADELVS